MIRYFISRVLPRYRFVKPRMVIGIPSCIPEVERRAVEESAYKAGAREVIVLEESLAAAIGADIPIHEPAGHMVCDIGGGTTEISVMSLGGMVVSNAIRMGGDEFDAAIIKYVKATNNLIIGAQMAEHLKVEIGNAVPDKNIKEVEVKGTNASNGLPQRFKIGSDQIREALRDPVSQIVDNIKSTLGQTPPELAADIVERGIVMTGGGSLLRGLDKLISTETGVPVIIAEYPLDCVAQGAGKYFDFMKGVDSSKIIYDSLNG
jgi:rod shape-determining protein MreB